MQQLPGAVEVPSAEVVVADTAERDTGDVCNRELPGFSIGKNGDTPGETGGDILTCMTSSMGGIGDHPQGAS